MRFANIVVALPLLFLGQTGNLDDFKINGRTCPLEGDARSADVKDLNRLKGRYHSPVTSDIDPTVTLTAMAAPGDDEDRFDVKSAATVTGFVLEVMVGGKETCNCHAIAEDERDTHIALTLSEDGEKKQSVVAEVTPRTRFLHKQAGEDWTTETLKRNLTGKWVEVTGWLLFDFEHIHQAENTNPGNRANWRATCWEIHPVTSIKVLPGPPSDEFRVAAASVRDFQRAHAARVNHVPKRKRFVAERNERYIKRFAEDEKDMFDKPPGGR
jgi:hypothetical protein